MEELLAPRNDLEQSLLDLYAQQITLQAFVAKLRMSPVVVLSETPVAAEGDKAVPAVIKLPQGGRGVALFTSLDRTLPFVKEHPEFQYSMQAEGEIILSMIPPSLGIVVIASERLGFGIGPGYLAKIRHDSGQGTPAKADEP